MARYSYDRATGRYRDASGHLVSPRVVRDALDAEILSLDAQARDLANALRSGSISLDVWEQSMRDLAKQAHLDAAALAAGGWDNMTSADFGRVGRALRDQYNYLGGFAGEIAAGFQPLDGNVAARAVLYTRASRTSFEAFVAADQRTRGATEQRSIRHLADSCADCIAQERLGWQPIGTLIPIGQRQCLGNCGCTMAYR